MEDGFQLSHLKPLTLDAPLFVPLESLWQDIIFALAVETADEPPLALWKVPPPEQSLWHFVARTALPVRGPSLA